MGLHHAVRCLGPVGAVGVCMDARHALTLWGWGSAWQVLGR